MTVLPDDLVTNIKGRLHHYPDKYLELSETEFLQQIQQNQGIIHKLVSLYAQDVEEKKDMYQEVLLQAWRAWPSFKGQAKFSTWLYRVCLNTLLTLTRKKSRVDYRDSLDAVSPLVENKPADKDDARRVLQAIRKMAETDRAIISLHLDGYDNAEIAAVTGIKTGNVAVKLHRVKQQLANILNTDYGH